MTGTEMEKVGISLTQQRLTCLDDKAGLDSDSAGETDFAAEACPGPMSADFHQCWCPIVYACWAPLIRWLSEDCLRCGIILSSRFVLK